MGRSGLACRQIERRPFALAVGKYWGVLSRKRDETAVRGRGETSLAKVEPVTCELGTGPEHTIRAAFSNGLHTGTQGRKPTPGEYRMYV